MPSPKELLAVGHLAEAGLERVSPQLADKLAGELPHLLDDWGKAIVRVSAHSQILPLMQIGEDLQKNLAHFKLPADSSLDTLKRAARLEGLPTEASSYNGFRMDRYKSRVELPTGAVLETNGGSTRHGSHSLIRYIKADVPETSLSMESANSRAAGRSTTWTFKSPDFTHAVKTRRY